MQVGTIGNAGTVIKRWRSGGSNQGYPSSNPENNGSITGCDLGVSTELIGSTIVITTGILLGQNDNLDQAFQNLSIKITLRGGLDGDQTYKIGDTEKSKFPDNKSIVAAKAIKLQTQ